MGRREEYWGARVEVHEEPVDGFSAGRGDPQKLASATLPTVGELTRVCTYDRPNTTLGEDIELERDGQISTPVDQPHEPSTC